MSITAEKARELTTRGMLNLVDEQLRLVFEKIRESASDGNSDVLIFENNKEGFDSRIWIDGPIKESDAWKKVDNTLTELGFKTKLTVITDTIKYLAIYW